MSIRPFRDIKRRETREINVGKVKVGGGNPISVQSMTNTLTTDIKSTINQINEISSEGADIVRVSCPDEQSSKALKEIIKKCESANTPVMIHHQTTTLTSKWIGNGANFVLYTSDKRKSQNGFVEEFNDIKVTAISIGKYKNIDKNIEEEIV